ncbi:hypothetical protein [Mycolicibacterium sarraceniae]|uniref:Uncharacterized protein n=1 Tax=Mycolicibacterium sarraceniae TaxID=1534348 RepID=A0A7I7SUX8_9MYCO|nr:hypothetical protein [Mycolicibacterium sarraceniae]BBY59636.1 hypothetical protein MSAR_27720 [Mycolicibacterium sarraceniae]
MRRALGPFLTTGLALTAAAVVVANPVAPPSRDMQISTTQLSTSPDLLSPSDKSLLSALSPQLPPGGLAPALAQILAALAADADRISREVASESAPEVLAEAALPDRTAYRPEPLPAPFVESANATPAISTAFAAPVQTNVQQVLSGLVADTSYLGGKVSEAAYAAVDVIISAPEFVFTAVIDLLNGDISGALDTVRSAIKAVLGPVQILVDGIRNVLFGRQVPTVPPATAASVIAPQSSGTDTRQATAESTPASTNQDTKGSSSRNRSITLSAAGVRRAAATPQSTDESGQSDQTTESPAPGTDGAAQTPTSTRTPSTGKPAAPTRPTAPSSRDTKTTTASGSSTE